MVVYDPLPDASGLGILAQLILSFIHIAGQHTLDLLCKDGGKMAAGHAGARG
jgi:hypothetical protein